MFWCEFPYFHDLVILHFDVNFSKARFRILLEPRKQYHSLIKQITELQKFVEFK